MRKGRTVKGEKSDEVKSNRRIVSVMLICIHLVAALKGSKSEMKNLSMDSTYTGVCCIIGCEMKHYLQLRPEQTKR